MLCPSHKSNKFPRKILQREKYDRVEAGPLASRLCVLPTFILPVFKVWSVCLHLDPCAF